MWQVGDYIRYKQKPAVAGLVTRVTGAGHFWVTPQTETEKKAWIKARKKNESMAGFDWNAAWGIPTNWEVIERPKKCGKSELEYLEALIGIDLEHSEQQHSN